MSWFWLPVAGLLAMDRRTAFNFMFSRPLVISVVIGIVGGNMNWCLLGGVFFEIIGLMDLPVGTRVSLDDTFGAFAYSIFTVYTQTPTLESSLLAIIIAFTLIFPVTAAVFFIRWCNKLLLLSAMKNSTAGKEIRLIAAGQALSFLRGVICYAAGTLLLIKTHAFLTTYFEIKHIAMPTVAIIACLIAGYFSGFFHSSLKTKVVFLLAGGVFSWLLL